MIRSHCRTICWLCSPGIELKNFSRVQRRKLATIVNMCQWNICPLKSYWTLCIVTLHIIVSLSIQDVRATDGHVDSYSRVTIPRCVSSVYTDLCRLHTTRYCKSYFIMSIATVASPSPAVSPAYIQTYVGSIQQGIVHVNRILSCR